VKIALYCNSDVRKAHSHWVMEKYRVGTSSRCPLPTPQNKIRNLMAVPQQGHCI
jgi:hypothetical protein